MAATTLHKAIDRGESVAETLHQASRENMAAARRTVRTVGRTLKHGYEAAYDAVEETTHLVKRHPWPAMGIVFGAAFAVGMLAGWKMGKKL